jgi:hypothetical protein
MHHLSGKSAMDQLHHYILLHTSHKTVLRNTIRLPSLCKTVDLYGFKCSNFVALCTDDSHTPISWDSRLNDIYGDASESAPIHLIFLLNGHAGFALLSLQGTCCSQSLHLVDGLFILKPLNIGHLFLNFQRHLNTISFFYGFRQQTPSVLHSPRIHVQQFTCAQL